MKPGMRTRIITGLLLIAIVLPPVILGGPLLRLLISLISLCAAYEISALKDSKPDWLLTIIFTLVIFVFTFVSPAQYAAGLGFFINCGDYLTCLASSDAYLFHGIKF